MTVCANNGMVNKRDYLNLGVGSFMIWRNSGPLAQIVGAFLAFWSFEAPSVLAADPAVFSHYGGVGNLRTRSARMAPPTTLSTHVSWTDTQQRYALTFQAAPWLETTFSYSGFDTGPSDDTFDRQFDIKVQLWDEGLYLPAVAVGLQDFLGTGLFSGEYIVASKRIGPFDLSLGAGWGTLGSRGTVTNPLVAVDERFRSRGGFDGTGGEVNLNQFFRGDDVGVFGAVIWDTPIDGLKAIAEYDSDDKDNLFGIEDASPFNFGLTYDVSSGIQLGAAYIAGDTIQLQANFSTETARPTRDVPTGQPAPLFYVRALYEGPLGGSDGLVAPIQPPIFAPVSLEALPETLAADLGAEGLKLSRIVVGDTAVRVILDNDRYRSFAKAAGRATRILSRYAPAEIERFDIAFEQKGMTTTEFRIERKEIERTAYESGYSINPPPLQFTYVTPGSDPVQGTETAFDQFPDFDWSFGPGLRYGFFDPDDPLRVQLDLELEGTVEVRRGLFLSGSVAADVIGNFDNNDSGSNSQLPRVRTDIKRYNDETDIGLYRLTGEYFFSPADNVYAKVSAGLYEQTFGGFGGEVLWRPPNSRFAFGAEAYYVRQRGFDTLFNFQDYDIVTGHGSIYYDSPYRYWNAALHVGRYLAGDLGATLEVTRRFPNGWEVGAFATLTDVPFDEFGEGSFDKGLTLKMPLDWGLPQDIRSNATLTLRPIQRDGGARLKPGNRLFGLTLPTSQGEVGAQWSSFAH